MHRPFVRAVLVMVVLICGVVMHGYHADHADAPDAEAAVATHAAAPVGNGTPGKGDAASDPADPWADGGHLPHGDGCDTAVSANAAHADLAPLMVSIPAVVPDDGETAAIVSTAVSYGRSLLLLHCISRT